MKTIDTIKNFTGKALVKYSLPVLLFTGIGFHGKGQDATETYMTFEEDAFEKIYLDTLQINLDDKKQYIVQKNKISGLKEINKLNKTQMHEEGWLYLPLTQTWHETGIQSTHTSVRQDIERKKEILKEYNKDCVSCFFLNDIYFVHNHPLTSCKKGLSKGDLISLVYTAFTSKNYSVYGIVVEKDNFIEYSLKPEEKEKLFKTLFNRKDKLKEKKFNKFQNASFSEVSKFFNMQNHKL